LRKRLRAELHERYADRLDTGSPDLPDLDEFVGYHLEQAYWLRTELGESDRRTERLAEDGGRRLGDAGMRAAKRGDAPAAASLLRRATVLLASPSPLRAALLTELGLVLRAIGDLTASREVLKTATAEATAIGDRKIELWARMEDAYVEIVQGPSTADELLDLASEAMPVFEASADDRILGRACLLIGWVQGGHRGLNHVRLETGERALTCYRQSAWPIAAAVGAIANALYFGSTPTTEGVARCEELLRIENLGLFGRANLEVYLAGYIAQIGEFPRARTLLASASRMFEEFGQPVAGGALSSIIGSEIDLLAGDTEEAARRLRSLCAELKTAGALGHLASASGRLAEALYRIGRYDEAFEWTQTAENCSAADDLDARSLWMPVRAKLVARRGELAEAVALAMAALELVDRTDALNLRAKARLDCGVVFGLSGRAVEARAMYQDACDIYARKGNEVAVERTRSLLGEPVPA
jgi:tetratricopeptide (TPR) repeat protein